MNVLMIFLDGVGVGSDDPSVNPFKRFRNNRIDSLLQPGHDERGRVLRHIDANLGVAGLPQSGTGQATLFTGINCAEIAGRHFGPFPHSATKDALKTHNIFHRVQSMGDGYRTAFVNAYPPPFFKMVQRRNRWTVTTRCCLDAGVKIRDLDDLAASRALAADITGVGLAHAGFEVDPVSEEAAASVLATLAQEFQFTLFEYFLTDKAGHSQSFETAGTVLKSLDQFLDALLERVDSNVTVIVTSDHGNLEDLSTRSHTRNPVPLIAVGRSAQSFSGVKSIADVTPAIIKTIADA